MSEELDCNKCDKQFVRKWTLRRHMERVHGEHVSDSGGSQESDDQDSGSDSGCQDMPIFSDMVKETEDNFKDILDRKTRYLVDHDHMEEVEAEVEAYNELLPRMHSHLAELLVKKFQDFRDLQKTEIYKTIQRKIKKLSESMDPSMAISAAVEKNRFLVSDLLPEMVVVDESSEDEQQD